MHAIRIDRGKPLAEEPHVGHNRYHPDIAPVAEVGEGVEIALETRDALDGQIKPGMAAAGLASIDDVRKMTEPRARRPTAPIPVPARPAATPAVTATRFTPRSCSACARSKSSWAN